MKKAIIGVAICICYMVSGEEFCHLQNRCNKRIDTYALSNSESYSYASRNISLEEKKLESANKFITERYETFALFDYSTLKTILDMYLLIFTHDVCLQNVDNILNDRILSEISDDSGWRLTVWTKSI